MQRVEGYENFNSVPNLIVTDGTFDGVHTGHQVILKRVVELAKLCNGKSAVITYKPHPRNILFPHLEPLPQLSSLEEKAAKFEKAGIDYLIVIEFTREFSKMHWQDFVHKIFGAHIKPATIVVGYDHRFGCNREGNFELLSQEAAKLGIQVEEIPKQEVDAVAISSTKIRNALMAGDMLTANTYLGYRYELTAIVEKGNQIGRTLNFPTANLKPIFAEKLIPANGVYAVWCHLAGAHYPAMLNIGTRPTLNGKHKTIEAHIFNFDSDIYHQLIKVEFIDYVRPEQKFENLDALKQQLQQDKTYILSRYFPEYLSTSPA